MSDEQANNDELPADAELNSREVWDRIIEYDEALAAGQTVDLHDDETVRGLPDSAREQVFEVLECLDFLADLRCQKKESGRVPNGQGTEKNGSATREQAACSTRKTAGSPHKPLLKIGRFEILHEIGSGGHGIVFLAHDPALRRRVAIKVPRPEFLLSEAMRARFVGEARAAAALDHPNIIKVLDAGFDGTICYIAQELCEGATLAKWMRQEPGPVKPEIAALVVMHLADALHHAHRQGILHRDLKPANVLLKHQLRDATAEPEQSNGTKPGFTSGAKSAFPFVPKVADFGICKAFGDEDGTVTRTGTVVGTATYMAPEQAAGNAAQISPQTDVYGLGAILYEMLTGHPPIQGDPVPDIMRRVLTDEPAPVRESRPDVPAELEAVCLKCLEKSPHDRYATAADLCDDLRRFLDGKPVRARRVGNLSRFAKAIRRQRRSTQILLVLVLVGWASMVAAFATRFRPLKENPQASLDSTSVDPETSLLADVRHAFTVWHENAEHLRDNSNAGEEMATALARHIPKPGEVDRRGFDWHYLWRLCHPAEAVGQLKRVISFKAHATDAYYVAFSRDGSQLATSGRDRKANVWDAATGKLICTCSGHTDDVNWVDFSPNQRCVATASDDHTVKVWDATTGNEQFTLTGHACEVIAVLFSPKANTLVSGDNQGVLNLWDLSSRRLVKSIPAHRGRIQSVAFGPEGHVLASIGDDQTVRLWEMPELLFRSQHGTVAAKSAAFSPDGGLVALGGNGTINIDDVQTGGRRTSFSNHLLHIESVRFSPDGKQIASCDSDGTLRLWDLPSGQGWSAAPIRYQTNNAGQPAVVGLWCVAYSPDGTRLATSARDGIVEIWDASVTAQWTLVTRSLPVQRLAALAYSPHGERLAVAQTGANSTDGALEIWDVSSPRPALLHAERATCTWSACFSGDGNELVAAGGGEVEVFDAKTGARRLPIPLAANSVATAVAYRSLRSLIVLTTQDKKWAVQLFDSHTGAKVRTIADPFFSSHGVVGGGFDVSADGNLLAICSHGSPQAAVYDLRAARLRPKVVGHRERTGCLQFAPHEPELALAVIGGVELWDLRSGEATAFFPGFGRTVGMLAYSADGRLLFVGSNETKTVEIWNLKKRKQLFALPLPSESAANARDWRLTVSPGGQQIACSIGDAGGNGGIYLFSALQMSPGDRGPLTAP